MVVQVIQMTLLLSFIINWHTYNSLIVRMDRVAN